MFLVSKSLWISLVVMLIIVIGAIFGVSVFLNDYTKHDEFVEVPAFEGFHYSEVDGFISDKDLSYEISDSIFDPFKPRGIVLEQLPKAGELVKPNRKVYLTINSVVPPSILLPELRDITVRQVLSKIETYGLKVDSLIYRPAECDNCVIGVIHNGAEVLPGTRIEKGSSVSLVIGEGIGSERIAIPYLYKRTLAEVRVLLIASGLNVGYYEFDTTTQTNADSLKAFLYRQIPAYDTINEVRQGQAFELFFTLDSNKIHQIELIQSETNSIKIDG
ncbi:MAG: hypothetical protein ACI85Q_000047 [Salibacteraceae bacterium]